MQKHKNSGFTLIELSIVLVIIGLIAMYLNVNNQNTVTASSAATDSTTTCYNSTSNAYSMSSLANYGAGGNCALSFRFQ